MLLFSPPLGWLSDTIGLTPGEIIGVVGLVLAAPRLYREWRRLEATSEQDRNDRGLGISLPPRPQVASGGLPRRAWSAALARSRRRE